MTMVSSFSSQMELVDGGSLREHCQTQTVSPSQLIDFAHQAALGLAAIHRAGLVHRDVKPDNLLVDASSRLLVADLGISQTIEFVESRTPRLSGTPPYMAPELLEGYPATQVSDQFSLCLSIAELALSRRPPRTQLGSALVKGLVQGGLSKRQSRAIARGTEPRPVGRHSDVSALAEALAPRASRRILLVLALVVLALVAALTIALVGLTDRYECSPDRTAFAKIFNPTRIERVLAVVGDKRSRSARLSRETTTLS